jgi:hypothetical protein
MKGPFQHGRRIATLLLAAMALLAAVTAAQEAQILLDPKDVLGLDETAVLEIRLQGGSEMPDPTFQLENFRVVGGPSQATSLRIVNGRQSASRSISWQLQPRKLGRARVFSVRLEIEGRTMRLPDRQLKVVEKTPPGRRRRRAASTPDPLLTEDPFESILDAQRRGGRQSARRIEAPKIFLRAEISPRNPYVGQQVIYTLNLYAQVSVRSVNPEELPDFKGFWAQVIPQPPQLRPKRITYEGETFGRVVLLERALFPRRSGRQEIEAVSAHMMARIPDSGPYGSPVPRSREIIRASNPVTLDVREPPEPPAGYNGAVGQLRLSAELEPRQLEVGEAATLTLHLEGKGHLQGIAAPAVPELAGIEVFEPQQQSNNELKGKRVYGSRTWSYVLMPEHSGEWTLPPIEMAFFDPDARKYRVTATEALELAVSTSRRGVQADGETVELHPVRTAALPVVSPRVPLAAFRPWLFALPWVLAVLVLVLVLGRRRGVGHRPLRRQFLESLAEATHEQRPRQAAALIETAWRNFLNERWEIPAGAPSTQWAKLLAERGVEGKSAEALVKLADDIHYLRYAPKLSSIDELRRELVERSRTLVRKVG